MMVNMRERGLRTLTGCQDVGSIRICGQGLCVSASQTGCASESIEDFSSLFMFKSDLRATEFESLGGAQEVFKCSQNDSGPWNATWDSLSCVSRH